MKLVISEKQLKNLIHQMSSKTDVGEQAETSNTDSAPNPGTSSDGDVKTNAKKWESGVTRGPANQIGVTKWSDSYNITRGKANPLSEQGPMGVMTATQIKAAEEIPKTWKALDPHTKNTVLAIGAAFIPFVGPFISAGIGVYDAKLYHDEGDDKTAGMTLMFSLMPGVGSIVNKIPFIKELGPKVMGQIGKKLALGLKITNPNEIKVLNQIAKNRQLIQIELDKAAKQVLANVAKNKVIKDVTIKAAKETAKKNITKKAISKGVGNIGKSLAGYGALGYGYNKAYDKFSDSDNLDLARFTNSKEKPVTYEENDMELVDGIWIPKD